MFKDAGFEWRGAGCSMCLGMNPDKLEGDSGVCLVVEPQLQGTAGKSDRAHAADEPGDGGGGGRGRRGDRRDGSWPDAAHDDRSPRLGRGCRCAATTSTPTASSRRASCAASRSRGWKQHLFEDDRKTGGSAHRHRSTSRVSAGVASCSSTRTSAADRRASTRRRRSGAGASRRSSANRSRRSSSATRR